MEFRYEKHPLDSQQAAVGAGVRLRLVLPRWHEGACAAPHAAKARRPGGPPCAGSLHCNAVHRRRDGAPKTLSWAINQANANSGSDITFQIPTVGTQQTITVTGKLPAIKVPTNIRGATQ